MEPADHGDEPSHVVTGLMVRDWVVSGAPRPAMRYAEDYYLHYPRVAIGHWPPLFYVVQAAWTLVLPPSRPVLLLLMALLTAIFCVRTGQAVLKYAPGWPAFLAGVVLLVSPPVLVYSRLVMAEVLLSWLCLETVLALVTWMETPGWSRAAWFAVWAALACLTKVTAAWLAPMTLLAILLSGRWKLLREPSFWAAGLAVGAMALPWYLLAPGALHQASPDHLGVISTGAAAAGKPVADSLRLLARSEAALRLFAVLWEWLGPFLLMGLLGVIEFWRRRVLIGPAVAASLAGMMMMRFLVLSTAFEERTAMPVVALIVVGLGGLALKFVRFPLVAGAAVAAYAAWSLTTTRPKDSREVEAAVQVALRPEYRDAVVMIVADAFQEGAFVAELALNERRPGHTVLRGSKLLARSTWNGNRYQLLVRNTSQTAELIDRIPVGLLVVDGDPRDWKPPHIRLMAQTVEANPQRFRRLSQGPLIVYEVKDYRSRPRGHVNFYMYGLGRSIGDQ